MEVTDILFKSKAFTCMSLIHQAEAIKNYRYNLILTGTIKTESKFEDKSVSIRKEIEAHVGYLFSAKNDKFIQDLAETLARHRLTA